MSTTNPIRVTYYLACKIRKYFTISQVPNYSNSLVRLSSTKLFLPIHLIDRIMRSNDNPPGNLIFSHKRNVIICKQPHHGKLILCDSINIAIVGVEWRPLSKSFITHHHRLLLHNRRLTWRVFKKVRLGIWLPSEAFFIFFKSPLKTLNAK